MSNRNWRAWIVAPMRRAAAQGATAAARMARAALAAVWLAAAPAAIADYRIVWEGQPTLGQWLGAQSERALLQARDIVSNKAAATAELQQARAAYFASFAGGTPTPEASRRFAERLHQKDTYHLMLSVVGGVPGGRDDPSMLTLVDRATGAIDGGLPLGTRGTFVALVRHVRAELGVTDLAQPLSPAHVAPERWRTAMATAQPLYDAYRSRRDEAEHLAWALAHPAWAQAHPQLASPPLHKQRFAELRFAAATHSSVLPRHTPAAVIQAVQHAERHRTLLLKCQYGKYAAEGGTGASQYAFWHGSPPPDVQAWFPLIPANERQLRALGNEGHAACPASEYAAIQLVRKYLGGR